MRPGATVIDVGINRITDAAEAQRIFANFPGNSRNSARKAPCWWATCIPALRKWPERLRLCRAASARYIAMLMSNTVKAARLRRGADKRVGQRRRRGQTLMLRVGLTGGIATGKTTVVAMLRELGCRVLEADKIAHQMIEPGGAAYDEVVREFGRGILTRKALWTRKNSVPSCLPTPSVSRD